MSHYPLRQQLSSNCHRLGENVLTADNQQERLDPRWVSGFVHGEEQEETRFRNLPRNRKRNDEQGTLGRRRISKHRKNGLANESKGETAVSRILRDSTPETGLGPVKIESDPCSDAGRLTKCQPASFFFRGQESNRCEPNALSGKFRRA